MYVPVEAQDRPSVLGAVPDAPGQPIWQDPRGGLIRTPVSLAQAAACPIAVALFRNRLQCSATQLAALKAAMGWESAVTTDDIATTIANAHDGLWLKLTDPTGSPRRELLVPTPSDATMAMFRQAFGQAPTKLPWPGAKQNLGGIVATRLGGARSAMLSCSIKISCWGWPWSGGGVDRPMDYMVKALPGQERVALGALFWRAIGPADWVSPAAAMLAAGLVIRYGVSYQALAKPLENLHCHLKYALTMLGHPVPTWVTAKCPWVPPER